MADLRLPVRDRTTKAFRDVLKQQGLKLIEIRCYAVIREDDGEELCRGTYDDVFTWSARQMREWKL